MELSLFDFRHVIRPLEATDGAAEGNINIGEARISTRWMGAAGIDGGRQRRWAGIDVTPVANDRIAARAVAVRCATQHAIDASGGDRWRTSTTVGGDRRYAGGKRRNPGARGGGALRNGLRRSVFGD